MHGLGRHLVIALALLVFGRATAQIDIVRPNFGVPTKISPAYFGPNAFPVPDMLDGRTSSELSIELYGDCFFGTLTERVADDVTWVLFRCGIWSRV